MRLMVNPTRDELFNLLINTPDGNVRALRTPSGEIYAWAAHEARHVEVATALNLPFKTRLQLQAASYLFNRNDVELIGHFIDFSDLIDRFSNTH